MSSGPTTCTGILTAVGFFILIAFFGLPVHAQNIVDDWNHVRLPPAPELRSVNLDARTSALLMLDFNKQACNPERRPRCVNSIPLMEKFLKEARAKGARVIYSLSAGATAADIAKALAPTAREPVVTSGPDKFLGTELEKVLKERGVKTVVTVGTAAHGALLYTASGAALRGFQVIVPVDGISAESLFAEQAAAWILANAPRISTQVTLTKTDMIKWEK